MSRTLIGGKKGKGWNGRRKAFFDEGPVFAKGQRCESDAVFREAWEAWWVLGMAGVECSGWRMGSIDCVEMNVSTQEILTFLSSSDSEPAGILKQRTENKQFFFLFMRKYLASVWRIKRRIKGLQRQTGGC